MYLDGITQTLVVPPVLAGAVVNLPHYPCTFLDMAPNWSNGQYVLMTTRDLFFNSRGRLNSIAPWGQHFEVYYMK